MLGARLNTWARERIVQSSIIASLDQETSVAAAPPPTAATPAPGQEAAAVVPTATPAPVVTPTPAPINVLLLGTDERPDEGVPMRTDTMILLSLDPSGQTLGMLSLPRDLWVPITRQEYDGEDQHRLHASVRRPTIRAAARSWRRTP